VISQPTDQLLPRRQRRPLSYVKTERQRKKNGEKPLCFYDFTILSLTFFSVKLLFSGLVCDP
jgi:hypothetical protein